MGVWMLPGGVERTCRQVRGMGSEVRRAWVILRDSLKGGVSRLWLWKVPLGGHGLPVSLQGRRMDEELAGWIVMRKDEQGG